MHCKICNSEKLDKIELKEKYYYCQDCELIFIDETEIVDSEEEKARYEGHDNNHQNLGYVKMFNSFIEKVIDPYTKDINNVLEFGCGPGPVLADLLADKGFAVDIYDPYFYPEKVYQGKEYDLITSTEVFEHFSDPAKEIENLVQHLKTGGYLAIMTSFHPGADKFAEWWYKTDPTHITFYNQNTFKDIARRFSLELVFDDREKYCLFKK